MNTRPVTTVASEGLAPLIDEVNARRTAYRRRKDENDYVKIHPADEPKYAEDKWQSHKSTQSHLWLKRRKSFDRLLEDQVWCLFYKMGYPVLNGPRFRIHYKRNDGTIGAKQIDVFAKDDETAIVVECKARESRGRRPLQKDIHETENLQKGFSQAIRLHFGKGYNPKIIWIYATSNIIWAEKDLERAEAANIRVITENELQYFEAFIGHIGTAGRYQFLAEFLEGQQIPGMENVKVPAVRGKFGPHTYYSFVVSARHLLKIAFVNHQALNHPDGKPAYQRMINKKRIADIGTFIQKGGYFPTNLLVNFVDTCRFDLISNKENADKNTKFGWLHLPGKYKSAWVIDGQHRLYGFSNIDPHFLDRSLFVLAFEKMDAKTEAELFITINHEQRSVSKSLLVTLQADLKLGSGDPKEAISALASALVRLVNSDSTSPFFRRFEVPGVAASDGQNLTVGETVKGLIRSNLLGRALPKKSKVPGYLSSQTDEETLVRARKVFNIYFRSIMDANPTRWEKGKAGHISTNPGIRAHCQLINEVLNYLTAKNEIDAYLDPPDKLAASLVDFIEPFLSFVETASDKQVEPKFSRKFGEGGVTEYFYNLCEIVQRKHKDFGGQDFKKFKARQADARVQQTNNDVGDLQHYISKAVVETLKKIHGVHELPSGEKAYWDLGIDNLDIKQSAYKKQQMVAADKRSPKEAYLDLIDFDKILKQPSNWSQFEPIFSIPMAGEKNKKYYLNWLEKLNEIRRVNAHKNQYRTYSDEDHEFIAWIKPLLYERFEQAGIET